MRRPILVMLSGLCVLAGAAPAFAQFSPGAPPDTQLLTLPSGVVPDSYPILSPGGGGYCLTVNAAGQITALLPGSCFLLADNGVTALTADDGVTDLTAN